LDSSSVEGRRAADQTPVIEPKSAGPCGKIPQKLNLDSTWVEYGHGIVFDLGPSFARTLFGVRFFVLRYAVAGTKTYVAKPGEIVQNWWLVDGSDQIVGRLASRIAVILMGKHRPTYTPHVDTGDFVVVINCDKVRFVGDKLHTKTYTWFTGYTGLRMETAEHRLKRAPELILREAVRRMLPKNKLGEKMLSKLKLYTGTEHPHQAQDPRPLPAVDRN
jgi:large subunit ribosomal protein L13